VLLGYRVTQGYRGTPGSAHKVVQEYRVLLAWQEKQAQLAGHKVPLGCKGSRDLQVDNKGKLEYKAAQVLPGKQGYKG
jgi:hypothetical protein